MRDGKRWPGRHFGRRSARRRLLVALVALVACCMVVGLVALVAPVGSVAGRLLASARWPSSGSVTAAHVPIAAKTAGAAQTAGATQTDYIALGDSYSSGEGNPPFDRGTADTKTGDTCHRSAQAWPRLLAEADWSLHLLGLVACSGATTDDIYVDSSRKPDTFKTELPQVTQLKNLSPHANALITITIGGNDVGFAPTFADCYRHDCYSDGTITAFESKIKNQLPGELATTFKSIAAAAPPGAQVIVVGYPNIITTSGWDRKIDCGGWLTGNEQQGLIAAGKDLDQVEQAAATAAGFGYASTLNALAGHEMCTPQSWVKSVFWPEAFGSGTRQQFAHPLAAVQWAIENAVKVYLATPHYSGGSISASGQVGVPLSASATITGGVTPLTVFSGTDGPSPPSWIGLSVAGRTVTVSGTPDSAGSWTFSIVAEDAKENVVSIPVKLTVANRADSGSGSWAALKAPLPADAGSGFLYSDSLSAVSCPSASYCVAVGGYTDTSKDLRGLLVTWSSGTWTAAQAPLPANALPDDTSSPGNYVSGVSCASASYCLAVGSYATTDHTLEGLLLTWSGGKWTAVEAPLPDNAISQPGVSLHSVSCPSATSCVAVGQYEDVNGGRDGVLLTWSGGDWTATRAPIPDNGRSIGSNLLGVSCPSATSCVAAGTYNQDAYGDRWGELLTWSGGDWTAMQAPLPANAADDSPPDNLNQAATLSGISCPSTSFCMADGIYEDKSQTGDGLLLTLSDGTWSATQAPIPEGGLYYPISGSPNAAISCPSVSYCVGSGTYLSGVSNDSVVGEGELLTWLGGAWAVTQAPLPADATSTEGLTDVSCASESFCVAIGDYTDSSNNEDSLLLTSSS